MTLAQAEGNLSATRHALRTLWNAEQDSAKKELLWKAYQAANAAVDAAFAAVNHDWQLLDRLASLPNAAKHLIGLEPENEVPTIEEIRYFVTWQKHNGERVRSQEAIPMDELEAWTAPSERVVALEAEL